MYIIFLLDWLTVFNREQILVIRLEDYAANLEVTIKKVFDFLSVGTYPKSTFYLSGSFSMWLSLPQAFTSVLLRTLLSSLQALWGRGRQSSPNGPSLTPGGEQTGTWVLCFQPPETFSGNFTNPLIINWLVCWTIKPSSGVTPEGAWTIS